METGIGVILICGRRIGWAVGIADISKNKCLLIGLAILLTGCTMFSADMLKQQSTTELYAIRQMCAGYPDLYQSQLTRIDTELDHRNAPSSPYCGYIRSSDSPIDYSDK